ncbi:MAG TPA: DUF4838 domain-containing protein [Sphingobium sp.]|nr:DUF4838 domain-containing protein [Sphingobium sp.]
MKRGISRRAFSIGSAAALLAAKDMGRGMAAPAPGATMIDKAALPLVVTPDAAKESVLYAAQELADHLAKAIGARPPILSEARAAGQADGAASFYLGDTAFARSAGIDAKALPPEGCLLRTVGNRLCIVGSDAPGDPLDSDVSAGTLFGVYELLEQWLKVRWLWPGEGGTVVPRAATLTLPDINETFAPAFIQRHVRLFKSGDKPVRSDLGFSPAVAADFLAAQRVYLRRHRMGRRQRMGYGHAFGDWWARYGDQHPEWFQLVDGKRGPVKKGGRYSMSIAEPGLHEQIVSLWREKGGAGARAGFINAVENDIPGLCECPLCQALDSPPPADYLTFVPPQSRMARRAFVTDRYARSWLAIQQLAARDNPDVTVIGYAYANYFVPPTSGVRLNRNILIGFCPSGWFYPRSAPVQEWMKKQWRGWAATGARVFLRVNYFLDGYCMPFLFPHQFADEFRNAARNGLVATDFDSLTGQWATQGPTLYLMMRLQTRPEADPDALLDEYYGGFGRAAPQVRAYFAQWEAYTGNLAAGLDQTFRDMDASRWKSWAKAARAAYPDPCFAAGEALLAKAAAAVSSDPEALERVRFLQLGLEHAKLCSRAAGDLSLSAKAAADPASGRASLDALVRFRRAHEGSFIANLDHCAWVEGESWQLS